MCLNFISYQNTVHNLNDIFIATQRILLAWKVGNILVILIRNVHDCKIFSHVYMKKHNITSKFQHM